VYHVIGSDQQECGPLTASQLNEWVTDGRLGAASPVRPDRTGEWQPLQSLPEYTGSGINPRIAALQNTLDTSPKTCPLARASLVMGILGIVSCGFTAVITGPAGMILGLIANNRILKHPDRLAGRGLALAGVCLSAVTLFIVLPLLVSHLLRN
jgi:hypothetical protein